MDAIATVGDADSLPIGTGSAASSTDFPTLFQTYLHNGTVQALHQVRIQPDLVQDTAARENVLHMLTFALDGPTVYAMAWEIIERLTPAMEQAGLWDGWIPYLHKTVEQSQWHQTQRASFDIHTGGDQASSVYQEAYCSFWLGQLYQNRSDFPAAQAQWTNAVTCFAALNDRPQQAKSLNRLAYLARLERRYDDGASLVTQALALLAPDDPERSFSYFVQGAIAFDKQQWQDAVTYFQSSLVISEQQGDTVTIARRLRNMGPPLRALGRYDEAIACYERAIDLFAEVYDPVQQAVTRMNLGVVYFLIAQPRQALVCFDAAETVFRNAQDHWHLAMCFTNQGIAQRMVQEWEKAKHSLAASIALWGRLGNVESQVNALDELACVHLEQGDAQAAIVVLQQAFVQLDQMKQDPAYPKHRENLDIHFREATEAVNSVKCVPVAEN